MFDPALRPKATFSDLLDRVLDRGVVINADVIISLAGVPLIGLNLRAALAGIETMAQYGVLQDWYGAARVRGLDAREADREADMVASGERAPTFGERTPGMPPAAR